MVISDVRDNKFGWLQPEKGCLEKPKSEKSQIVQTLQIVMNSQRLSSLFVLFAIRVSQTPPEKEHWRYWFFPPLSTDFIK